MKPLKITINETSYSMKFGIACLMQLGKLWQTNTINETTERLVVLESISDDVSFEFIQVISDLVSAAIFTDKSNDLTNFDSSEIPDIVLNDSDLFKNILLEFMQSMPRAEGKKIPTSKKQVGTNQNKK